MAIRTKSRPPAIAHGTVQQNCDPAVARQHATTSNSASSLSLSPSDTAHLGAALDESPASEGRSTPMEHTSNPSLHSEHSGDSSYVRSSSFVDCEFESMTAEDWAKWSKEVSTNWGERMLQMDVFFFQWSRPPPPPFDLPRPQPGCDSGSCIWSRH